MARNTFISFAYDSNISMAEEVRKKLRMGSFGVDYSEKTDRREFTDETIWKNLLTRINGSSVTIILDSYDLRSKATAGYSFHSSPWVYKEISTSLRDWNGNALNGIVYVVPDSGFNWYGAPQILSDNRDYIVLVEHSKFMSNPGYYIDKAYNKREEKRNYPSSYEIKYDYHNR